MTGDRILIVEDDPYIAEAVGVHLELSGYGHTTLDDGRAAAEHLRDDHAYDLALLDVMLPGLDGFQLMEPLRAYGTPCSTSRRRRTCPRACTGCAWARRTTSSSRLR